MGDSYEASLINKSLVERADLLKARLSAFQQANDRIVDWVSDYAKLQARQAAELEQFLGKHVLSETMLGTLAEPWQRLATMVLEQAKQTSDASQRARVEGARALQQSRILQGMSDAVSRIDIGDPQSVPNFEERDREFLAEIKTCLTSFASVEVDRAQEMVKSSERAMQAWIAYDPADGVQAYVAQLVANTAPKHSQQDAEPPVISVTSTANPRQPSQPVVRRKTSFFKNESKSGDESRSPSTSLKSKVGSLFGRRKQKSSKGSTLPSIETPPRAPPSDFGPRMGSVHSARSTTSSIPSLIPQRQRDDAYASSPLRSPARTRMDYGNSGALESPSRPAPGLVKESPARGEAKTGVTAKAAPKSEPSTERRGAVGVAQSNGDFSAPHRTSVPNSPSIPSDLSSFANGHTSPSARKSPVGGELPSPPTLDPTALFGNSPSAPVIPPVSQLNINPNRSNSPLIPSSFGTTESVMSPGAAPMPPPARHSMHRVPSLTRTPSAASSSRQARQAAAQPRPPITTRDSRVGSQVFANLPLAPLDLQLKALEPSSPVNNIAETNDELAPLPSTPYGTTRPLSSGQQAATAPANAIGSPEQFWTPAQRFAPQFPSLEQTNASVVSVASSAQHFNAPLFPVLPTLPGLVAAIVEHIEAEYEGDEMVKSSVQGDAIARINDSTGDAPSPTLGVLLADPNAHLAPSSLLQQTSSLSFDVPAALYTAAQGGQELAHYSSKSAMGRVPVKILPVWRFEANAARVVLALQLNDLFVGGDEVELTDLVVTVSISGTAKALSAQSKPVATFSREKQRITWRFHNPMVLHRQDQPVRLLCQFVTDGEKASPGRVELKARIRSISNSVLQLRTLSSQGEWVAVPAAVGGELVLRMGK